MLFGLIFSVLADSYIRRDQRRIMLVIAVLCLSLIAQNLWENWLFVSQSHWAWKNALAAYGYSARPVILILFLRIVQPEGNKRPLWALAGINAALYCTSPWTKLCFAIRESDFVLLRGPLWFVCFAFSGVLLADLLARTILRYRAMRKLEQWIPICVALTIIASVVLDLHITAEPQPITYLTIAIIVGSVFFYIWLHLQFVREHERDLMAAQRIQIMMTQIQPHFLFNALNTIRALYAKDPPLADKTLEGFSTYLRQNLESLSQADLIPIARELEHTRLYAEIEVLRFPNIRVEYRIEDEDFRIPALTIQPLVENAIRHGVRSRRDGLVIVSTAKAAGGHSVTVEDNGVGFDPGRAGSMGGTHIGLQNVKERVERMCGGGMAVRSAPGKGASVTLLIPEASQTGRKELEG